MEKKINYFSYGLITIGIIVIVIGLYSAIDMATFADSFGPGGEELNSVFEWLQFLFIFLSSLQTGAIITGIGVLVLVFNRGNQIRSEQTRLLSTISVQDNRSKGQAQQSFPQEEKAWELDTIDEEKIYELYKDKAILEIIPTTEKGYIVVTLKDFQGTGKSYQKVVYTDTDKAVEVEDQALVDRFTTT